MRRLKSFALISFLFSMPLIFKFKSDLNYETEINNETYTKLKYFDELSKQSGVITPNNYDYILNPGLNICGEDYGQKVKVLAMIPISPEHFNRRFIIRNTWGSGSVYPKQLKILFLLGMSKNETINLNVK
jgi:hypothetical protein